MSKIDEYLHAGYGTTLAVYGPGSHALTVWGYEYLGSAYKGIYVTDSDDHANQLVYYPVAFVGSEWDLGGAYSGWHIGGVEAIAVNPEPVSSILFVVGGAALALVRRKKRRLK